MRLRRHHLLLIPALVACAFIPHAGERAHERADEGETDYPSDYFYVQRAMPDGTIPSERIAAAVEELQFERALAAQKLTTSSAQDWVQAGPFSIGGRVNAIVAAPGGSPVFLGSANGGVWRSDNQGVDWVAISDGIGTPSIGTLAQTPQNAHTLWCGTGDANGTVDGYDGTGLFVSRDDGVTWVYRGLRETSHISSVVVSPTDSNRVFVGAMGKSFTTDPNRGLYRSLNGGGTWTRTLFINDSTGVSDVAINPAHPETVYCSTWERVRRLRYRRAFGVDCAVWRSIDGGTTWAKIVNGLPPAGENLGRIAIAVAPTLPSRIYASVTSGAISGYVGLGLFRSDNGGNSWVQVDQGTTHRNAFGGFSWYFGLLEVSPVDANDVWTGGTRLLHSIDGGVTLTDVTSTAHVDQHAVWVDPADPNHVFVGNDGGFWWRLGGQWQASFNLPITQFYAGTVDAGNVNKVLGGAQDNGTSKSEAGPLGWISILGGDGFQCLVDPPGSGNILAEWQYCCDKSGLRWSTNNGASYFASGGWVSSDRFNWNTPFVASARNMNTLIAGSMRVYKSVNTGAFWTPVSDDLTDGPNAQVVYNTISALAISAADSNLYLAGTDDGHVWRSQDGGDSWQQITTGLPKRYVTNVSADPNDAQVIYVSFSGFGEDLHDPRVYRSANRGQTWAPISGNLPDAPVNDMIVDPLLPGTIYAGTDLGVFVTRNEGQTWTALGGAMPIQPVWDLELHQASRRLFAFTHGRSAWMLDLGTVSLSVPTTTSISKLALTAPSPNPARGAARLDMTLAASAQVDVSVFDAAGRRVRVLAHGTLGEGRHPLAWDARDERGSRARAGVYFVRASDGSETRTQRLVIAD